MVGSVWPFLFFSRASSWRNEADWSVYIAKRRSESGSRTGSNIGEPTEVSTSNSCFVVVRMYMDVCHEKPKKQDDHSMLGMIRVE